MPFVDIDSLLSAGTWEMILALAGVLTWVLAYILIFRQSFRYKTYGIPAPAIALNITWEFVFLFIFRPHHAFVRWEHWLWFLFDLPNVYLLLRYGRKSQPFPVLRKHFLAYCLLAFVLAFLGHVTFHLRFDDPGGGDVAFMINYVMSALFVYFALAQHPGLSYGGAWAKLLGTLFIDIANVISWIGQPETHYFMLYLFCGVFFFDAWYVHLLHSQRSSGAAKTTAGPAPAAA
jgi:hypothetical protein